MLTVNSYIESADLPGLDHLLSWKEGRSEIAPDPVVGKVLLFFKKKKNTLVFVLFLMAKSSSL